MIYSRICYSDGKNRYTKVNCKSIIQSLFHVNHEFFISLSFCLGFVFFTFFCFNLGALKKDFLHVFHSLVSKENKHFATNQNKVQEIVKTIQFQQIIQFHVHAQDLCCISIRNILVRFWDLPSCIWIIQFSPN
jgi:hypothetical protein